MGNEKGKHYWREAKLCCGNKTAPTFQWLLRTQVSFSVLQSLQWPLRATVLHVVIQQWKMLPPGGSTISVSHLHSHCGRGRASWRVKRWFPNASAQKWYMPLLFHQQSHLVILSPLCREPGEGGRPQHHLVSSNYLGMVVNITIP